MGDSFIDQSLLLHTEQAQMLNASIHTGQGPLIQQQALN